MSAAIAPRVLFDSKLVRPSRAFARGLYPPPVARPTDLERAWADGHFAGLEGAASSPPWHLDGPAALGWVRGWEDAQAVLEGRGEWDDDAMAEHDAAELAELGVYYRREVRD